MNRKETPKKEKVTYEPKVYKGKTLAKPKPQEHKGETYDVNFNAADLVKILRLSQVKPDDAIPSVDETLLQIYVWLLSTVTNTIPQHNQMAEIPIHHFDKAWFATEDHLRSVKVMLQMRGFDVEYKDDGLLVGIQTVLSDARRNKQI
ncbi:MAG: hypothetical protein ABW007_19115 [Chitinophagaceae bacterium]